MKFEWDREKLIKIACIALVIMLLPFSFELVFLMDLGGIDFAVTFLMLYLGTTYRLVVSKWESFKVEVYGFFVFVSQLYMFKPKIFVPHIAASGLIATFTCSLFLTCIFWIPAMYLSSGFLV